MMRSFYDEKMPLHNLQFCQMAVFTNFMVGCLYIFRLHLNISYILFNLMHKYEFHIITNRFWYDSCKAIKYNIQCILYMHTQIL